MSENDLEKKVLEIVSYAQGITAKDIAKLVASEKSTVNSILYRNTDKVTKASNNKWFSVSNNASRAGSQPPQGEFDFKARDSTEDILSQFGEPPPSQQELNTAQNRPKRSHAPWNQKEDLYLREQIENGVEEVDLAAALKRSVSAVISRKDKLFEDNGIVSQASESSTPQIAEPEDDSELGGRETVPRDQITQLATTCLNELRHFKNILNRK